MNFAIEYDYFRGFAEENELDAKFSLYGEGINFDDELPVYGKQRLELWYTCPLHNYNVAVPIDGNTWGDLYKAADSAIKLSNDDHHIYIEDFKMLENGDIELITGS